MANPPYDNKTIKETVRQVTNLEKRLGSLDATTAKIVKNISKIIQQLDDGTDDTEELIDGLGIWAKRLDDVLEKQKEITNVSNVYQTTLNQMIAASEGRIEQIKDAHQTERDNLALLVQQEKNQTQELRAQNEIYNNREAYQQAELTKLNAQQVLIQNQLLDENISAEKKLALQKEYEKSLKQEADIKAEAEESEQKKSELTAKTKAKIARKEAAEKLAKGEKLDPEKQTAADNIRNAIQGSKEAYDENRNAGMSPIKALINIKETIKAGNDQQAESFNKVSNVLSAGFNALNNLIDNAARVMESSYGRVNAAIDGTGKTFSDFIDGLSELGISPLIRQEKLLENLSNIASSGITTELEQLALLTTIKDKTVASFDATDGNLRRLVRLNQNLGNLSAKQFGLAAVLRTELNAAFGDSSYMAKMFQQMTGTIIDAVSANAMRGRGDSTNFYAVMETFAAGLYEAGVDEGTVSALAQGINYLGSGNVQALSGNKSLQNLLLLSMDRAGLDYASILQQGLTTNDTYILLSEIIDYLADITDNTKQNNVLRSSYANLFNLSVTDMNAIKNLSQNNTFRNYATASTKITGDTALQQATNEMLKISEERTMFSEILNNFTENAKFSFGVGVANSSWAYPINLLARLGIDAGRALTDMGLTTPGKITLLASAAGYAASIIPGVINLVDDLKGNFNALGSDKNTISNYFTATLGSPDDNQGLYGGGTAAARTVVNNGSATFKTFESTYDTDVQKTDVYKESATWEEEQKASEEDPNTKILKEFEKTLMKANEGDGYAFAVSLQGMSDGVLRSFASIFADEDAMMNTLTGKNNALEQNNTFIDYVQDTSTKSTSASGKSTGTANRTSGSGAR